MKIFKTLAVVIIVMVIHVLSCEAQQTSNNTTDEGVVINGVKWATRNVDKPGTFAKKPETPGMFYQWNNNIAWSATNPITNSKGGKKWDYNHNRSTKDGYPITKWATTNDPSPKGWRLPTAEEFRTLFDTKNVFDEWITQNGVKGKKFTDKKTGQSIFFPAAGNRHDESVETLEDKVKLYNVGEYGIYWSSNSNKLGYAYYLLLSSKGKIVGDDGIYEQETALSIRCVAK